MALTDSFKVSLLPMTSIDDESTNLNFLKSAISQLPEGTQMMCLPENSLYLNLGKDPIPESRAFSKDSPVIKEVQALAKDNNLNIHCGGLPWLIDGKVYNEALLVRSNGELDLTYEKLHLFDVNLGPGLQVYESRSYNPGQRMNVFEVDGWKFATTICYDLRFPEIFVQYREKWDVDAFLVPAAFTTKTGELHWKPLLQARAIETQAFILAPAQVGYHRDLGGEKLRKSWGQSLIIGPWGKIYQETGSYREFLDSNLTQHEPIHTVMEREKMTSYRQSVPVADHRRYRVELVKK